MLQSSQIIQPSSSITSNADVVQAINSMSSSISNQMSIMGTQLASLVSLTSRLIEISGGTLAATERNAAALGSAAAVGQMGTQSPAIGAVDSGRGRVNGTQSSSFAPSSVAPGPAGTTGRPDTRQGQLYQNPSNNFRTTLEPVAPFGSTLRGASPASNAPINNSLSAAAGRSTQQQSQQSQLQQAHLQSQPQLQQPDPNQDDLMKSRLPSPVFPDDPIDMSADISTQQTPSNLNNKRLSTAGQGATSSAQKGSAGSSEASLGDWKGWLNRSWHPPPGHNSRAVKYRTMQEARRAHRDTTKRSMATLGRLPLKEFLEIRPEQYLGVRKTGRKLYQEWLLQEVRLAKQPEDRVKAAINRLENDHPELGDCEDHWKARQLLQQIIDNAIDEANLNRKKEARNSQHEPQESTPIPRNTSMLGLSQSSSSSALADADRGLRGADTSTSSIRKGNTAANGPAGNKGGKAGNRRKADQADLDDTPSRFRQPPNQRNSMLGPSGDDATASTLQASQASLSSSGLEAAHSGRGSTLADYGGGYANDSSTIGSAPSSDAMQPPRQHAQHSQHLQQPHHNAHQDQTHNAWASQTAAPGPSLFGQSNYAPTATQQTLSHHQPYAQHGHHGHHHNSNYLASDPGSGLSTSQSGLLDDQRHQSHMSPLVNGGSVRMHHPQQQQHQQAQSNFFDGRGYQ